MKTNHGLAFEFATASDTGTFTRIDRLIKKL